MTHGKILFHPADREESHCGLTATANAVRVTSRSNLNAGLMRIGDTNEKSKLRAWNKR